MLLQMLKLLMLKNRGKNLKMNSKKEGNWNDTSAEGKGPGFVGESAQCEEESWLHDAFMPSLFGSCLGDPNYTDTPAPPYRRG